jgi:hypothetical protein
MKKSSIITIAIGVVLVAASCVMVNFSGVSILNFVREFSESKHIKQEKVLEVGEFSNITVDSHNNNIKIVSNLDVENVKVEYYTSDKIQFDIGIVGSELFIKQQTNNSFMNWFNFNFGDNSIVVHVPADLGLDYNIDGSNGEIIFYGIDVNRVDARTSNAMVDFSEVQAGDRLTLKTSNAKIKLDKLTSYNDIDITTSNGPLNMSDIKANTVWAKTSNGALSAVGLIANKIWAKTSNGSIELERLSADDITLNTSNAFVKGSIIGKYDDFRKDIKTSNGEVRINGIEHGKKVNSASGMNVIVINTSNAGIDIEFDSIE